MRARGWVIAGVLGCVGVAPAVAETKDPKPLTVDIKDFKDRLQVLKDSAGGTYVILRRSDKDPANRAWYGTGKTLYEQVTVGYSTNGDAWSIAIWAPRIVALRPGALERKQDGTYFKSCDGHDDFVLTEQTGDKAKAVLDKFTFVSPGLVRRPHLLARDDSGVYYYVDKLSNHHGGKGFRVFVGRKGGMKQLALTDVASDSAGQVFSTKTGDLRLINTVESTEKPSTAWVKGGKKTELIQLDTITNSPVIFNDLGLYKFTGSICENM